MKNRWLFIGMLAVVLTALLGVSLASAQTATPTAEPGVVVVRVDADGPAAAAGIKRGDILLAVDTQQINQPLDWFTAIRNLQAGKAVSLKVQHGDATKTLKATVADRNSRAYLGLQVYLGGAANDTGTQPATGSTATPTTPATPTKPSAPATEEPALSAVPGAQVMELVQGSPAAKAGLQVDDVITAVDNDSVADGNLADIIGSYSPGDKVTLTVARGGDDANTEAVTVTLGKNPDDATRAYLGIRYANTNEMPMMPFVLPNEGDGTTPPQPDQTMPDLNTVQGALVRSVVANGPAAKAGLQADDIITAMDGEEIADAQALVDAVAGHKPADKVTLTVTRMDAADPVDITVTLGKHPDDATKAYLGVSIASTQMQFRRNGSLPNDGSFQLPFDLDKLPFDLHDLPFQMPELQDNATPQPQA